tara:strand:+ start:1425 stop:2084 length:660 start_codon:yes stop_codon:yes gene_type:complete
MFKTIDVISASVSAFRLNEGFIKKDQIKFDKKYENKIANSDLLYFHFYGDKKLSVIEEDTKEAEEIIDYLKGLSFKAIERELTDFESNVLKLVTADHLPKDKIGIAASLPKVYQNKVEQDAWTDRENLLSRASEPVGKLHTRETFKNIAVEFVRYIPRTMSYLVTCSIDDKHILKFFTDKNPKSKSITVTGYVKEQSKGRYHNGIETIINRLKVHEDES